MFANYTEETCTGTGATLTLTGALTDRIAFSESFADGDLVAYILDDSAGTIKVAGIGTYVSATDDITRNDTWNWNGTAVDDNPATNITLSGGPHTVRCGVIDFSIYAGISDNFHIGTGGSNYATPLGYSSIKFMSAAGAPLTTDKIRILWTQPVAHLITDALSFSIDGLSGNAGARYILGLYRIKGRSLSAELLFTSSEQDGSSATGSSGNKVITFGADFEFGITDIVGIAFHSNDTGITAKGNSENAPVRGFGTTQSFNSAEPNIQFDYAQSYVTSLPSSLTVSSGATGNFECPTALLRKA